MSDPESGDGPVQAVVLDYLAHGRADDERPQYRRQPVAYAVDEDSFALYEIALADGETVGIGDRIPTDGSDDSIDRMREAEYGDLSSGAQAELEYVIEDIVAGDEQRFVDVYNDAQPITLRLHQLNLLPGIGEKLRNAILDQRKRGPFEDFEDVEQRVSGLHDPEGVIVDRILEEIKETDHKYRLFVR